MGKTVQTIALIVDRMESQVSNSRGETESKRDATHGGNLIICPVVAIMQVNATSILHDLWSYF